MRRGSVIPVVMLTLAMGACAWCPAPAGRAACRGCGSCRRAWWPGWCRGSPTVRDSIDLAAPLNASTPIIHLPPPFANTPGLKSHRDLQLRRQRAGIWSWNWIEIGEHVGTHFDAPCHWVTGKDKPCVDAIEAKQFVGPAAVIDVTAEVAKSADFVLTPPVILEWEKAHGRIPKGAWVICRAGWGSRGADSKAFFNAGADGSPHYPGFGKDSATFLTTERDILGVGTEAVGTHAAIGAQADPPFPNHSIMHGAGKFGLTQLANVDRLPLIGALMMALRSRSKRDRVVPFASSR